ncbi:MAG TPA: CAP domain-containing protein [Methanospirillum sp.]|nr:CAP domain-containing protein [Methanospirillum sp.]
MSQLNHLIMLFLILLSSLFVLPACATNESAFDLAITTLQAAPSSAPQSPLYIVYTVENKGTRTSMTDTLSMYLSPDQNISAADYLIGTSEFSFLNPKKSINKGFIGTIPADIPTGTYYAGALLIPNFDQMKDGNIEDNSIVTDLVTITRVYKRPQEWYNERISDLVLTYTNTERSIRSLGALTRDTDLDVIARENSQDMATRQFFDHKNPDGEDPIDRAKRHGYNQFRVLPNGIDFYGIGENIVKIPIGKVYQFGDIIPDDPDQLAKSAVISFMNSPAHKEALLLPEHEKIGIGTAFDGEYYYITQNFF